ncbi:cysteine hydrolase [Novosphingobium sp. 1949]|uniref:Cysteine hydrolase n=1 Tax=Novosphingobium organovorum TaxID=2930092 RepID=A0ABT0BFI8_9SPHN|nr:cysteine hydrolase [Novosphingobium organovorum]MCJ2183789.1 cysteine hydrolase [Novosphingobium organovorum]
MTHPFDLPDWAVERGRAFNTFATLDPATSALVVIDMQRAFVGEGEVYGKASSRATIPAINALCAAFRRAAMPVLWTRQSVSEAPPLAMPAWQYDRSDPVTARAIAALAPGAPTHALDPAMNWRCGEPLLNKYRYGAFSCPAGALAHELERRGVDTLVLTGTLTNVCVESTAREANMRGFKVIVVADACSAVSDAEHSAALLNLRLNFADVRLADAVIAMARGAPLSDSASS